MKYAIGVDLGGTTVKIGIFTQEAKLVSKWEIKTRKQENGKYILSDIASSVLDHLKKENINSTDVKGIGMGVPGAVQPDGSVHSCINLGWGEVMVKKELESLTGFPVYPANDANVAALGESWQGGGKGCKNTVMVTLGTGVGGGIIIDGKIVTGTSGFGGEIGHMKMKMDEKDTCGCGKKGCLEQYASATGVTRIANRTLAREKGDSILRGKSYVSAKDVFDAAKAGDKIANQIVEEACGLLALGLSYIACVCDPEIFIIGGGVSKAGTILTDTVQKHYVENVFGGLKNTKIVLATLGNDAGIYGGAKLALGE